MNSSIFRISLDIHEIHSQVTLYIKKADSARRIFITLTENGRPYQLTQDCMAAFTAKKPDGNILYNSCVIHGNIIAYAVTPQTTAVEGELLCEIRLYGSDSMLITSPRFTIVVDGTVYSDGDVVDSSSEFSLLSELVGQTRVVKTQIETALKNGEFKGEQGPAGKDAVVDATLLLAGKAADAKQTGDRFRKLTDGSGEIDVHNIAARNVMALGNEVDGFYLYASGREDGVPVTELGGLDDDSTVRLRGVAMPKNSADASPKEYVDKLFAAVGKDGARIFRQAQEPLEAVDGDWWLDPSEDGGEDDDGCISDEELSKRIEDAVKAALDKIPYAEEVAY
ncbi:MAG: DUF2479 domain-containing protein [Ruminococcaceae bacterium]|nr:DUF2479 domain-containing protein [Oscillospiraceae bacterium]